MTQPPVLLVPKPVYPVANVTLPSLVGKTFVTDSCRGIGRATGLIMMSLGCSVDCSTRDLSTFNYSSIPSNWTVHEMDLRKPSTIRRFVKDGYKKNNGKWYDYTDFNAITVYNGDFVDYDSDDDIVDSFFVNIIGHIIFEREILKRRTDFDQQININFASSTAATSRIPQFQEMYNIGKVWKDSHVQTRLCDEKYPNIRFTSISCVFAKTNISRDSINPSADKGDLVQQQFQAFTISATPFAGVEPEVVALAHVQMMTMPNLYGGAVQGQVPQNGGSAYSATYYIQTYADPVTFKTNITNYVQTYFGLNMTYHSTSKRKRSTILTDIDYLGNYNL